MRHSLTVSVRDDDPDRPVDKLSCQKEKKEKSFFFPKALKDLSLSPIQLELINSSSSSNNTVDLFSQFNKWKTILKGNTGCLCLKAYVCFPAVESVQFKVTEGKSN